ncbi:hypothetical protein [Rummeliibacillus suwonensis]|uniref:hypothetical protein n=1 Tax=Rummeliibacillus suwonensis TaxID=1306154 RepID=UPI0011B50BD0
MDTKKFYACPHSRTKSYLQQQASKGLFSIRQYLISNGKRAKVHFNFFVLIYDASKLVADRIQLQLNQQQNA